jgi:hypothetical protein
MTKWVLLVLYLALLAGLFGLGYAGKLPFALIGVEGELFWTIFNFVLIIAVQALLLFSAGDKNICKPVSKPRFIAPLLIISMMAMLLTLGLILASLEFLRFERHGDKLFWFFIFGIWAFWGFIFYHLYSGLTGYEIIKRTFTRLLGGSLAELLAVVPMHIIVRKRGGCFAGINTSLGVSAGLLVMLWAFGPGIIFLFLREKHRAEIRIRKKKK